MMGIKARVFLPMVNVSLEELVPTDHFYHLLERTLDRAFVRHLVRDRSAAGGRPPPAHVSERSHSGHHRCDGNVQPGTVRPILGVCRDEPLGRLGAGLPCAGR